MYYDTLDTPIGRILLVGNGEALLRVDLPDARHPRPLAPEWRRDRTALAEARRQFEAYFDGERIEGYSEGQLTAWRARNVGFIFQFYNLMPILTAAQNVELPLLLTSLPAQRRKENVTTALKIVDLADRARHKPKELSGGQQQRVAIARAIVSDPKLLLCDEPTGDLDRSTANDILSTLQLLNRELGKTIIMVTHDPEAARFATRTLHLDKGQFVEVTA